MDESDNQKNNRPWLWQKGQSGNPKGRPKGPTLKEWARQKLLEMNDEERDKFLDGLPKEIVWQMAEGRPEGKTEVKLSQETTYTPEEIENAKQLIVKRISNRPPEQSSSGAETK